jgi:integrase/recombinase XerD
MTLQMQNRKSSTIARKLASVNSLFQYLMDLELVSSSPITKSHRPKVSQKIPSALSNEEVKKIIDALDSIQDKAIVVLFLTIGLRSSELLSIKKSNIIVERKSWSKAAFKSNQSLIRKYRIVRSIKWKNFFSNF